MKDCYCKNCGEEYLFVSDTNPGKCWKCRESLVAVKRRPTKRAADLAKRAALQKSLAQAEKILRKAGYTVTPPSR